MNRRQFLASLAAGVVSAPPLVQPKTLFAAGSFIQIELVCYGIGDYEGSVFVVPDRVRVLSALDSIEDKPEDGAGNDPVA